MPKQEDFSVRGRVAFALILMVSMALAVFGWAATAQLSGAVIAPGSIVVENKPQEVAHRDGGVVAAIHVRDGDRVLAGAPLIELDPTQTRAELGVIYAELTALIARAARLRAIARADEQIEFPEGFAASSDDAAAAMLAERGLFDSLRARSRGLKEQLVLQIGQLDEQILGLQAQQEAVAEQLRIITLELEQVRRLYKDGLTTLERVYALERQHAALKGQLNDILAKIAGARVRKSEIAVEIANVDQTDRVEATGELRTVEARVTELKQRAFAIRDRLDRMVLAAPQAGYVHEMKVNTIGGVVTPAETVLSIVPDAERLTVEARISPSDGDQVVVGRDVTLRFSAFDKERSPELPGRVLHVSADVSTDERTGEPYYLARVEIDDDARKTVDGLELAPGMPVEVFVSTGSRTALSYFIKPLWDHFERAMRGG